MQYTLEQEYCDVSVIIPHYNNFKDLIRAVQSVLNQTIQPLEIIIVDDASFKNEGKSIFFEEFSLLLQQKYIIFHKLEDNKGASFARNSAISLAKGHYLAFLDSDDIWHMQKLEIQYIMMQKMGLDFTYHGYITNLIDENKKIIFFKKQNINYIVSTKLSRNKLMLTNPIATPTVMVKRSTFVEFDIELKRMEDYECWVRYSKNFSIYFLNVHLSAGFKRSIGQAGLSQDIYRMHRGLIFALIKLYKSNNIGCFFFCFATVLEYIKYPIRLIKVKLYG